MRAPPRCLPVKLDGIEKEDARTEAQAQKEKRMNDTTQSIQNQAAVSAPSIAAAVPQELRDLPGWLIWRYEQIEGEPKPRKVPYWAKGGKRWGVHGRPEDRANLVTFDAARAAAITRGFNGVGLALMPEFGIVALDFDECMVDGGVHPDVENLVAGTYAEYSPSGNGVRAFMRGQLGNNKSPVKGNPYGFETFSTKGFVTVTGRVLDITELLGDEDKIADVPQTIVDLCGARFGARKAELGGESDPLMDYEPPIGLTNEQIRECLEVLDPCMDHDPWLHVGMAIHHETSGEGFALWDEWSAGGGDKYPGEETLQNRWDSFGQVGGKLVTARTLLKLAQENGAYINSELASVAEFEAIADTQTEDLGTAQRFQVEPLGHFAKGKLPTWIIKSVLPKAELAVMFGESGSGKSFLVMDMALAISRGVDWCGHKVKQGRVVYIAAEGAGGARTRANAYALHHGLPLDDLPFGVINAAPNFLQKTDAMDVAKAIVASGPCDVVIVDTFAQTTPGANENSAEDIGRALAHCKGIHRATGALVILVHHSGKDASKGARGWSGIKAAADAEIEVTRLADARCARISKLKDGEDGATFPFRLAPIPVGVDEDGDPITSCVVSYTDAPMPMKREPQGKVQKAVWNVVLELADEKGVAEIEAVVAEVVQASTGEDGKPTMRRDNIVRTITRLAEDAFFCVEGGALVLPQSSKVPQTRFED